jgi:hypothetical protein
MDSPITLVFAVVVIIIGLINLKELFLFKKGVFLMIPEWAKPPTTFQAPRPCP